MKVVKHPATQQRLRHAAETLDSIRNETNRMRELALVGAILLRLSDEEIALLSEYLSIREKQLLSQTELG